MLPIKSTSKAVRQLTASKNGCRRLMRCLQNKPESESCVQSRFIQTVGTIETLPSLCQTVVGTRSSIPFSLQNNVSSGVIIQRRGFLGCGDGDEGSNVLSKIHEEKRIMGYSPEQLFTVVAAVDMYQDFLPWCQRSDIVKRHSDSSFDAELEIGFKFLVESYVSHVQLVKPKMVKTTSSQSSLFDHLINAWEFNPGPVPGTCDLHFLWVLSSSHRCIRR
ncbi:uncharacterized protein LOC143622217 [Bidens hawaiensis]|uniref:uncharacterized protein LOC143622217 n=1 Tax=Bidens hawaiensis TaxID=980011 RepID=UPI0040499CE2